MRGAPSRYRPSNGALHFQSKRLMDIRRPTCGGCLRAIPDRRETLALCASLLIYGDAVLDFVAQFPAPIGAHRRNIGDHAQYYAIGPLTVQSRSDGATAAKISKCPAAPYSDEARRSACSAPRAPPVWPTYGGFYIDFGPAVFIEINDFVAKSGEPI